MADNRGRDGGFRGANRNTDRKPRSDRPAYGEKKFGERKFGEKKPYGARGDKPSSGEKKFGDKKPYGERKFRRQARITAKRNSASAGLARRSLTARMGTSPHSATASPASARRAGSVSRAR